MIEKKLYLYGSANSIKSAHALLENLPHVRKIDPICGNKAIILFLHMPLSEKTLIPLLASSGISGFTYTD